MDNEKLDNLLNLSLDSSREIREKSEVLGNGVNEEEQTWEVIAKYHGELADFANEVFAAEELVNGYAIVTVTKEQLQQLTQREQIEFIEMPKSMQYNTYRAKQASCILPLNQGNSSLNGRGILIGIIDSGIDYTLRDFQNETGSRILYLWDQTIKTAESGRAYPMGFRKGWEFTKADLDAAIASETPYAWVPSRDITGHGTAVAGIAAGSSVSLLYQGVAPESDLVVVKLEGTRSRAGMSDNGQNTAGITASDQNFPLTTDVMRAITYTVKKAEELQRPIAVNLSIGDCYGAHDGTSLLERFIDSVCDSGRNVICIGSGNEAASFGHTSVLPERETRVEFSVAENERSINVQIWKNYVDTCRLELEAPNGSRYTVLLAQRGRQSWVVEATEVFIYVGSPKPFTVNEEIFFDFIPLGERIASGIWSFLITPLKEQTHDYHFYLPSSRVRSSRTRFVTPTPELTMTIPAFASRALTVGAYDIVTNAYAEFSGRDRTIGEEQRSFFAANVKPDVAAPGVGILAPAVSGGYTSLSGTSFAVPIVTGSAALLMEWGILRGNDIFLYGEKVKAYLRKGARPLRGENVYPNAKVGWGALCVEESLTRE